MCPTLMVLFLAALALMPAAAAVAQTESFKGYVCTEDCSGHEAGYDWGLRTGASSATDCLSNSQSFTEGCYSWLKELDEDADVPVTGNETDE